MKALTFVCLKKLKKILACSYTGYANLFCMSETEKYALTLPLLQLKKKIQTCNDLDNKFEMVKSNFDICIKISFAKFKILQNPKIHHLTFIF